MSVEEEAQTTAHRVDVEPATQRLLDVVNAVGQREGQLLHGRRTRLPNVIAADRNRVPLGNVLGAEFDQVDDQPHGRLGGKDDLVLRVELFEDVVLDGAAELTPIPASLAGGGEIKRHDHGRGGVDRHRDADLLEVDLGKQLPHVVDGVDGHSQPAHFPPRLRAVAVEPHQGRQVEGSAQPGLALFEQEAKSLVGLAGRAEAGELPHCPQTAAVHGLVDAASERELSGAPDTGRLGDSQAGQIVARVERCNRHPAHRGGRIGPVGHRQSGGSSAVSNFDDGTGHIGTPQRLERASEKLADVDRSANTQPVPT